MPLMPLIVRDEDISWSQSPDTILIKVTINGIKSVKTNIVTSPNYIRVHYHPYIFEVFLHADVDDERGRCTLDETANLIIFEFSKINQNDEWPQLCHSNLDRHDKRRIRDEAVKITQKRHEEKRQALQQRRHEEQQKAVRDQIQLDGAERDRITSVKSVESSKALAELDQWRENTRQSDPETFSDPPVLEEPSKVREEAPEKSEIWTTEHVRTNQFKNTHKRDDRPIRECGKIAISFTPREFPTPSRESTAAEEEEWLRKQADARKTSGFNDDDLRPEERDPSWLLDKAESLMKAGSFLGAVSALSHAIKLAPKMAQLYVERAAAHLALKNLVKSVEDASQGLELLTPKVASNAADRFKCHKVRASGFRELRCFREALMDLKEAMKIRPEDEKLKDELKDCEAVLYEMELKGQESDEDF